ncbi:MAG: AzlD domain-containing protein [Anaerolineales bacterium]|nr:AzlD domain-containing protein [Anaerolineales bacterium]
MSRPEIWLIIVGGTILTYLVRLSFTVLVPPDRLSPIFSRGLAYIPPAVLAAIVLPELLLMEGEITISFANPELVSGIMAALVAWRLKSTWVTIATGMVALWLLTSP